MTGKCQKRLDNYNLFDNELMIYTNQIFEFNIGVFLNSQLGVGYSFSEIGVEIAYHLDDKIEKRNRRVLDII